MSSGCSAHGTTNCIQLVPIFGNLSEDEMLEVAAITEARTVSKGELIYRAGERSENLYVLHRGRVKIYRLSEDGKEQVIRVIGPGEFMGELSLFHSVPSSDYAAALEPSTMCIIEGSRLKELMGRFPSILWKVLEVLTSRLERAEKQIEVMNLRSVEHRLAQALVDLAGEHSDIELQMSKGDFASQLGMSQETLSRKLSLFQARGLIELKGQRGISIRDREGLLQI